MPAPSLSVVAEIAAERLDTPWYARGCDDRGKGAGGAVTVGITQSRGERTMTAHRMAKDGLPFRIDRKLRGNQFRQFRGDITPHAVMAVERRLRGVDIE